MAWRLPAIAGEDTIYLGRWSTLLLAALAAAFGFAGVWLYRVVQDPLSFYGGVIAGAVAGFLVHEEAHAYVARRQGCIAGFVLTKTGLFITLFSGVLRSVGFPFAFIAPGYVSYICQAWWRGERREEAIAAAGPLSNIALAFLSLILARVAALARLYGLAAFLGGAAGINAWIALFNLLPLEPLDGSKILRRNPILWAALLIAALVIAF